MQYLSQVRCLSTGWLRDAVKVTKRYKDKWFTLIAFHLIYIQLISFVSLISTLTLNWVGWKWYLRTFICVSYFGKNMYIAPLIFAVNLLALLFCDFPRQITGIPRIWKSNLRCWNLLWFGTECISSLKLMKNLFLWIWRKLLYWNKRFYPTPPQKFCCRVICTSKRTTITTIIQARRRQRKYLEKIQVLKLSVIQ